MQFLELCKVTFITIQNFSLTIKPFVLVTSLIFSSISVALGGLKAAKYFHSSLLSHTLKLPIMQLLETPSGNILNRFTQDINSIDSSLAFIFRDWISNVCTVSTTLLLFSFATPFIVFFLLPLFVLYYYLLVVHLKTSRQLKRMEMNSNSPIFSFFNESLTGKSVIKAFRHEDRQIFYQIITAVNN